MGRVKQDIQVPYLEDPNTGAKLFESESIVNYLQKQYGELT
ncbi:glutathione S-transferase, partial [Nakamurella silvestris]